MVHSVNADIDEEWEGASSGCWQILYESREGSPVDDDTDEQLEDIPVDADKNERWEGEHSGC